MHLHSVIGKASAQRWRIRRGRVGEMVDSRECTDLTPARKMAPILPVACMRVLGRGQKEN